MNRFISFGAIAALAWMPLLAASDLSAPAPTALRCEYLTAPGAVESGAPRLSWIIPSGRRGCAQTAWQVRVASSPDKLAAGKPDRWDSGRVPGNQSNQIAYAGQPLASGTDCYWQVRVWDENDTVSAWSAPARWSMGLLAADDWHGQWISARDVGAVASKPDELSLPPPHHYRKEFGVEKQVKRAVVYASALGLYDLYCNGTRVGDAYFQPGWSDYRQRAYYRAHDITALLRGGRNALGAVVADGWYAGYVGYALLVGYGPEKSGRNLYGAIPAFAAQLEIEYADGSHQTVTTDTSWRMTDQGPYKEADLLMGERYDARDELAGWSAPGYDDSAWSPAVRAETNPRRPATFHDAAGQRAVDLGFTRPSRMQAYAAPPVRVTQELPAKKLTEPKPGIYVFDLAQNFAGVVRLKVVGESGRQIRLRYAEMLNPDGTIMTENLRRARATDFYTLRGTPEGELWSPRFTYHGFRYVEVTGLSAPPDLGAITGLVLQSDTPPVGDFACSDPVMTQFARNAQWTQRANFIELPTDCPQRDERLGWMGDAQAYIGTAVFNADVAAFFSKWMDDVSEAQRPFGAYPDYAPYPMAHGEAGKTFGTGWTDAGIICPWTIWRTYGDTRLLEKHWAAMTRFMEWRWASTTPEGLGTSLGNPWGDWLNVDEPTPIDFIDTCYQATDLAMMGDMATALGRPIEALNYRTRRAKVATAFEKAFIQTNGELTLGTQTAQVLALSAGLVPADSIAKVTATLANSVKRNGYRMRTGFLGTKSLLPALSGAGEHDLAVRLFQSRQFPSWGYEVANGATSVWERWDSYTTEHGFNGVAGNQNAAMNSFSHYAFGAVMGWAFQTLAGINPATPGYGTIVIRPRPPSHGSNPDAAPISWVTARYESIQGTIRSAWKQSERGFELSVTIPANARAKIVLPTNRTDGVTESGVSLAAGSIAGVGRVELREGELWVETGAGDYQFVVPDKP